MKKLILAFLSLSLFAACNTQQVNTSQFNETLEVKTADKTISFLVDVMKTPVERAQGLMFIDSITDEEGMFFEFEIAQDLSFWMKNMRFPIDIIFIDENNRVLNIVSEAPACAADPCASYPSSGLAKYVLEINAGLAAELNIQVGDEIYLKK